MADGSLPTIAEASFANYERMGPNLLAEQPVTREKMDRRGRGKRKDQTWWTLFYAKLEARRGMLYSWRYSFWLHWSVLAQYFIPRRWAWLVVSNRMWRGNAINDSII